MLSVLTSHLDPKAEAVKIIRAINLGEGVFDNRHLRGKLALQVRQVESATVRYRVFPAERFELVPQELPGLPPTWNILPQPWRSVKRTRPASRPSWSSILTCSK